MQRFFSSWQSKAAGAAIAGGLSGVGWVMQLIMEKPPEWVLYTALFFSVLLILFGIWCLLDYFFDGKPIKCNLNLFNRGPEKIWLTEAIKTITARRLKKKSTAIDDMDLLRETGGIIEKLRELAYSGAITIYGSIDNDPLSIQIPSGYWEYNQIELFSAMRGIAEEIKTEARRGRQTQRYRGLKVNRSEINKIS